MRKSIKKNYIYNVTYQVLTLITPLITTPYVSRVLGAEGIGVYSFVSAVAAYFVLFAGLGTSSYGQREISYSQEDIEKRSIRFWETETISCISSALVLMTYIVFALYQKENRIIYLICAINIATVMFDISWLFYGLEEFSKIVIRNIFFKAVNIAGIFIFVKTKEDLWKYVALVVVLPLISSISLWFMLPKYVTRVSFRKMNLKRCFKGILELFIPTVAIQVYVMLDKVMLGLITGDSAQNGYYEQTNKLVRMVLTLVTALGTVMIPRIGHLFERKEFEELKQLITKGFSFAFFMAIPAAFGLIGISDNLIPWFFGTEFCAMSRLMKILSLVLIAVGLNNVTGCQYLIPTRQQKIFTITVFCGMITNVILNLLLIPVLKSEGAAIASVVAETVVLGTEMYAIRDFYKPKDIIIISKNYWIAAFIMLAILRIENIYLKPSFPNTCIMIFSGIIVYAWVLRTLKDRFFKEYILVCAKNFLLKGIKK